MFINLTPHRRLLWASACALVALITGTESGSAIDAGVVVYLLVHAAFITSLLGLIVLLGTAPLHAQEDLEDREGVAGNDHDGSGPTA